MHLEKCCEGLIWIGYNGFEPKVLIIVYIIYDSPNGRLIRLLMDQVR
jgi:hypothetical protein